MSSLRELTGAYPQTEVGEMVQFPLDATTTTGYLKCDGAIVSQATYSSLFAKVGLNTRSVSELLGPYEPQVLFQILMLSLILQQTVCMSMEVLEES
jgi:hypothetical protein